MAQRKQLDVESFLDQLRNLPGVGSVLLEHEQAQPASDSRAVDGSITITIGRKRLRLSFEINGRLDYAIIDRIAGLYSGSSKKVPLLLFTPFVNPALAQYLARKDLNFIDLAGNCRIKANETTYYFVTGKKSVEKKPPTLGTRAQGAQLTFALLAEPSLVARPIREIAETSGVSKSTVANRIIALGHDGFIAHVKEIRRLTKWDKLLERWIADYAAILEPRLYAGQYMTPYENQAEREKFIAEKLQQSEMRWAWGGLTAAWKLTRYYRDKDRATILFVSSWSSALTVSLKAMPASEGHLQIYRSPGSLAFEGEAPQTIHALLIYAQLANSPDERARETGKEIFDLFIKERYR